MSKANRRRPRAAKRENAGPKGSEKPKAPGGLSGLYSHDHRSRGHAWRVQTDDAGRFDELVVRDSAALVVHVEAMGLRRYFVDVAGVSIWVYVGRDGVARITDAEDNRPCAVRGDMPEMRDPVLDRKKERAKR